MGLVVWPMTTLEADDALASGAAVLSDDTPGLTGADLHAGQGPGPMREGRASRMPGPAQRRHRRRSRRSGRASVSAPGRCPTGWRWWGTAPTGTPGWPVGGQNGGPSSPGTAPSKPSPPPPPPGTCALLHRRGPSAGCDPAGRPRPGPAVQEAGHLRGGQRPPACRRRRRWTAWSGRGRRPGSPPCAERLEAPALMHGPKPAAASGSAASTSSGRLMVGRQPPSAARGSASGSRRRRPGWPGAASATARRAAGLPARMASTRATRATFDASRWRWNIDSPAKRPPMATPYRPPGSSPSADHGSTLCAQPSSCSRR